MHDLFLKTDKFSSRTAGERVWRAMSGGWEAWGKTIKGMWFERNEETV
jgi:hypothetical protein